MNNVTKAKGELEQALKKLKNIELALNESSIVVITDENGVIKFVNDRFCKTSKYSREELIGSTHDIVNSGYHDSEFMNDIWNTIEKGKVWKDEIKNKAKDGTYYWVDTTIVPFINDQGKPYQYIAIRHDITKRKEYEEMIEEMAYYDPLTSLPNKNALRRWIHKHPRNTNSKVTVLYLDLDHFKSINDTFGHNIGDSILIEISERLKSTLRASDFILRHNSDDFIIIIEGEYTESEVISIQDKVIKQLTLPYYEKNHRFQTSASIGISSGRFTSEETNPEDLINTLIQQANIAMFHAKKRGGNTYSFNTSNQNHETKRYYEVEQELMNALNQDEFSIVYQPIVNLISNKIVGAEALLRWNNPVLGGVPPVEFIPILEDLGQIIPVGEWIIRSACIQIKDWKNNGLSLERVSINVSPIQFKNSNFVKDLENILKETELEAGYIELEITEGAILDIGGAKGLFQELKDLGVRISIDDFGTGYSSLSYLKNLPIDTLKIDKSFIDDLDIDGKIIVNTIINMSENLKFTTIAEGIENEKQLDYLNLQNCDEGQGYYFGRPVPPDEFLDMKNYF